MSRSLSLVIVVTLALALTSGCANNQLHGLAEVPEVADALDRVATQGPLPFRLAVAPMVVEVEAATEEDEADDDEGSVSGSALPADPEAMRAALVKALDDSGLFAQVATIDRPPDMTDQDSLIDVAWDEEYDLLLETRVLSHQVSFVDFNDNYTLNLVNWFFWWFTAFWVADEVYEARVQLEVVLRSVHSGREVHREVYDVRVPRNLDDFERGWDFWGSVGVPESLDTDNWALIGEVVLPFAWLDTHAALLVDLAGPFRDHTATPAFTSSMAKTLVLAAGVRRHSSRRVPDLHYAKDDADAMAALATSPNGLGAQKRHVKLLTNEDATREGILGTWDSFLARRARPGDTAIFYFSGYGLRGSGKRPFLLPHDGDPGTPGTTAIPLDELAARISSFPNARIVVVVDAAFDGHSGLDPAVGPRVLPPATSDRATAGTPPPIRPAALPTGTTEPASGDDDSLSPAPAAALTPRRLRLAPRLPPPTQRTPAPRSESHRAKTPPIGPPPPPPSGARSTWTDALAQLTKNNPRCTVLAAAGPGQPAISTDELRAGLFTGQLLKAAKDEQLGTRTLKAVFNRARRAVQDRAGLEGINQGPRWLGRKDVPLQFGAGTRD